MSRAARATIELPAQKSAVKVSKKYGFDQTQPTTRDTNEGMKTNSDPKTPTRFPRQLLPMTWVMAAMAQCSSLTEPPDPATPIPPMTSP